MRKALVVGINEYPVNPLSGCLNDANAIKTVLETNGDGSPNFDVVLMTAPSETIGKAELRQAIDRLFQGDPEMALLYFSGHGFIKSTGGYLVTPDARKHDEGVSMDEILVMANQSKAKNKVIILDCCHSGQMGEPTLLGANGSLLTEGLSILTACRDEEIAMEVNGSGMFTALLMDALQGGAADILGNITTGSLYAYVDAALGAWSQRPIFKTNVSRFSPIRRIGEKVPRPTLRNITEYFEAPTSEFSLDPTYEYTEPTAIAEHVVIMKELQQFERVGLVVPVGEEHMYWAAINSRSCRLTALGYQYWRLAKEKKI